MQTTRNILILLLASTLHAKDKKLKAVPVTPPSTTDVVMLADLQAEVELLKAQLGWCQQEMDIWKNEGVMQVRLTLAMEERKARARANAKQAAKAK